MLFYSEERKYPTQLNVLTLQDSKASGYFYVHRDTYDAAVLLHHLYPDYVKLLDEISIVSRHNANLVELFYNTVPAPLNNLAPFLTLITDDMDPQLDSINVEQLVGMLSVISSSLDFMKYLDVPFAIRKSVTFSISVLEEYLVPQSAFFLTCLDTILPSNNYASGAQYVGNLGASTEEPLIGEEGAMAILDEDIDWDSVAPASLDDKPLSADEEAEYQRYLESIGELTTQTSSTNSTDADGAGVSLQEGQQVATRSMLDSLLDYSKGGEA